MPTRSFPESSGKPKTSGTPIYGSRSRVLPGGSMCVQAQPARKTKKSTAPMYGGRFRVLSGGSRWESAQPTGSEWSSAQPTEPLSRLWRQLPFQGRLDCADRASPERGGACDVGSGVLKRRIRELQFMAPGFVERMRGSECVQARPALKNEDPEGSNEWPSGSCQDTRQQVEPGTARRR